MNRPNRLPTAKNLRYAVMMMIALISLSLFSACGAASANAKKPKKAKAKPEVTEEDKTEANTETDENPTEPDSNVNDEKKDPAKHADSRPGDPKTTASKVPEKTDKEKKADSEKIWADLVEGNKRFMAGRHTSVKYSSVRQSLVKGQKPQVIVLGCADSRVPPEFVFDKNLGELFVVRDAGNIADAVSLGSIEYAVEHLHAKVLVIMGHESCGAVAAAVSGEKMPSPNLTAITESITTAFSGSKTCLIGGESNLSCVELNVGQSSKDILSKSPILKKAVDDGELMVVRAVYKLSTGEVVRLD